MAGWLLARGVLAGAATDGGASVGVTMLSVADADSIFVAGRMLFASDADGGRAECLGLTLTIESDSVTFTQPTRHARSAGAVVWQAADHLAFAAEAALPITMRIAPGGVIERSLGGEIYSIESAPPLTTLRPTFEGLIPATARELMEWIPGGAAGAQAAFTVVTPARDLFVARLAAEGCELLARPGGRCAARFDWIVEARDRYR